MLLCFIEHKFANKGHMVREAKYDEIISVEEYEALRYE